MSIVEACAEANSVAFVGAPVAGIDGRSHIGTLQIGPDGIHVAYRKCYLGGEEPVRFAPGDGPVAFELDGWRIGLGICKDTGVEQHILGHRRPRHRPLRRRSHPPSKRARHAREPRYTDRTRVRRIRCLCELRRPHRRWLRSHSRRLVDLEHSRNRDHASRPPTRRASPRDPQLNRDLLGGSRGGERTTPTAKREGATSHHGNEPGAGRSNPAGKTPNPAGKPTSRTGENGMREPKTPIRGGGTRGLDNTAAAPATSERRTPLKTA
jgi:hypothetical protein